MITIEKDVKRMEMQIEQLISIIANQNNRLNRIEDLERKRKFGTVHIIPFADRV
ncbi:hypothetical protein [Sporosarcina sp. E16_8]|uniref:hypothetical protein n=1 Tax=Sporosarcina sp. E16_8 TaxID=2789295 RepID=UPI001A9241FF|nr:hypothetical protein [Sporosarcina sp. E16_8]MBO0589232.1 hypothetical protein [Sporosarcina sp. E16_8]